MRARLFPTSMRSPFPLVLGALLLFVAFSTSSCSRAAKQTRLLARAEQAFDGGQYDVAKIHYLAVLRLEPGNEAAIARLGQIWFEQGAPLRAMPFLLRTRETTPRDLSNRLRLARCYGDLAQAAEAEKEAGDALQGSPDSGEALLLVTQFARSPKEVEAARQALKSFRDKRIADYHVAAATLALHDKDFAGAREALDRAVILEPKSVAAHSTFAALYVLQKQMPLAEEQFKLAAELSPARAAARIQYADFLVGMGRGEAGAKFLADETKRTPDLLPAWTLLAQIAFSNKEYDKALSVLENVFSRDGENLWARVLQGQALLAKGETRKSIETLERCNKTYPRAAGVEFQLARAYLQSKDLPKATAILDRIVRANPDFADAVLLWAQVNLQAGHPPVAVSALERLLQERPDLRPAQLLLANAYRAAGRLDDAAGIAREQSHLSPDSAEVYSFLGSVQQQQNKVEEARKSYEKAVQLAPNDPSQVNALLGLNLEQKRYDLASQLVRDQLTKNPNSAVSYYMEARVEAAQKNWSAAEVALKKAIQRDPSLTPAFELLVSVYLSSGKLSDATHELEEVLKKSPEDVNALTLIALTYQQAKNYSKAREAYERLLSLRPDHAPALNNLAYLYSDHFNEPDKALALAQKARGLRPADPSVADTLGWIDYQRGDYQQALHLFEESAVKLPENPELQFHLGMANYMMGQADAARTALKRATQATVDFPGKAEAERRLGLLGDDSEQSKAISPSELERLAQEFPDDVVILGRLGRAYEEGSAPEKAAVAYERALKVNPKLSSATFQLAKLYAGPLHDVEKGLAMAKAARQLAPGDQEVSYLVAQLAYKAGNYSWAFSLLREAARQQPTNSDVFHSLAWAAYALGNVPESRQAMQKVLEVNPTSTQVEDAKTFLEMTSVAEAREAVEAAEATVRGVLRARSDYVPALMIEADLEKYHHEPAKAADIYQSILRRYPEFAPAKKRLAVLYSQDPQNLDQAYALAMDAREKLPGDPEISSILGRISYERKDYRSAIQFLEQGDRIQSADSENLYFLGMAHVGAGHPTVGLEILKRSLSAGLATPLSVQAKETVAKLQERH